MLALALGAVAAASAAPAGAATPSLALFPTEDEVTLTSHGGRVMLDLGVFVKAIDGDFELRVRRPDYDSPAEIVQVDAGSGATLRELPSSVLRHWRGLREFFQVTIRNSDGEVVFDRYFRFCPNGSDRLLIGSDDQLPRYPDACRSDSPFVRGMVWGVQETWAVAAFAFAEDLTGHHYRVALTPGDYTVTMQIAPLYRTLFAVPPEDAAVTLPLSVQKNIELGRDAEGAEERQVAAPPGGDQPPDMPDPDPNLLPDLVALPPWNIELVRNAGRTFLTFAASPWNAGPGPLVVEGFRRGDKPTMDAFQYFYDDALVPVGRAPAGTLNYDARQGHEHWHFLQFSRYSLVNLENGKTTRSRKQSFCLAPTDAVDLTVPNAMWTPWSLSFISVCGGKAAEWLRESMPVGWADTYYQIVAGQAFDVTNLPNGRYALEIQLNPLGLLYERSTQNNVAKRVVILKGAGAKRQVKVLPWHSIDD